MDGGYNNGYNEYPGYDGYNTNYDYPAPGMPNGQNNGMGNGMGNGQNNGMGNGMGNGMTNNGQPGPGYPGYPGQPGYPGWPENDQFPPPDQTGGPSY
jgi:hypothetical protein